MAMPPALRWTLRLALIPAAVIAYISIAGLTGFCPSCKAVVDSVLGRHAPMAKPAAAAPSIAGLNGYTLEGEPVALMTHAGKPMIIEVWATWCPPCRTQRGIIHEMADELRGKVSLVALSVDTNPKVVSDFLAKHPSEMVELMAPPETLAAFGGVQAVPTLVFVDAKGTIRGVETGVHSAGTLRARISELATN